MFLSQQVSKYPLCYAFIAAQHPSSTPSNHSLLSPFIYVIFRISYSWDVTSGMNCFPSANTAKGCWVYKSAFLFTPGHCSTVSINLKLLRPSPCFHCFVLLNEIARISVRWWVFNHWVCSTTRSWQTVLVWAASAFLSDLWAIPFPLALLSFCHEY